MLDLIHALAGRPWAIRRDLALHVQGLVDRASRGRAIDSVGFATLRQFARLKSGAHAFDEDERNDRLHARRGQQRYDTAGAIALIPVIGTLTQRGDIINSVATRSTAELADEVRAAAAEPKVDAIVLEVDSPGGEVFGVPEAWAAVREAEKVKPIVAHANSLMASAALYVSSPATEIGVTPSGEIGSVGVYALHVNMAKALEDMGEEWEFVEADDSPFKVEGNPAGPLTDDGRAQLKKSVNRYMGMFKRHLATGRGVTVEHVLEHFGKGRMLGPQEAVAAQMADWVGPLEQAIRRAAQLARERKDGAAPRAAATEEPTWRAATEEEAQLPLEERVSPKPEPKPAAPGKDPARTAAADLLRTL